MGRAMKQSVKKYVKVLLNIALGAAVLLTAIFIVPRILMFFMPFVIGYVIALIASPLVRFFEEKLKIRRKAGTAVVIIAVIGLVVLGIYLIGAKLLEEFTGLVQELPQMWSSMEADIQQIGDNLSVFYTKLPADMQEAISQVSSAFTSYIGNLISGIGTPTIAAVGNFAKQLPSIVIGVIMTLLSSYFFVAEKHSLTAVVDKHMSPYVRERYYMMKRSLTRAVGGYLKAQLRIEVWMYLLLVIGLVILQVDYALLIALGIACLDFLPFFGTGTVLVPWSIVKLLSADYRMALGLLIIWGVGQLARQIIQPKIVGDSIGVPPLPTLFLLFIGYKAAGVIGMIFAVPLGIILYTMYQEGAFDTTVNSFKILLAGMNRFRRLTEEDMAQITPHRPVHEADIPNQEQEKEN